MIFFRRNVWNQYGPAIAYLDIPFEDDIILSKWRKMLVDLTLLPRIWLVGELDAFLHHLRHPGEALPEKLAKELQGQYIGAAIQNTINYGVF